MARCPFCGSERIRNGYRLAPLPLRAVGIRELLCDYCNRQFRAFSPWPPKQHRYRSQTASRSSASRANPRTVSEAPKENAPIPTSPELDEDITFKSQSGSQSGPSNNHHQSKRPPCPQCHSHQTYRRRRSRWERMALAVGKRAYVCESCGESFYAAPLHMEEEMSR